MLHCWKILKDFLIWKDRANHPEFCREQEDSCDFKSPRVSWCGIRIQWLFGSFSSSDCARSTVLTKIVLTCRIYSKKDSGLKRTCFLFQVPEHGWATTLQRKTVQLRRSVSLLGGLEGIHPTLSRMLSRLPSSDRQVCAWLKPEGTSSLVIVLQQSKASAGCI